MRECFALSLWRWCLAHSTEVYSWIVLNCVLDILGKWIEKWQILRRRNAALALLPASRKSWGRTILRCTWYRSRWGRSVGFLHFASRAPGATAEDADFRFLVISGPEKKESFGKGVGPEFFPTENIGVCRNRVHAKGVVLWERMRFCLLSTF